MDQDSTQFDPPAPRLPATPFTFVLHFVRIYWPAVLVIALLECGQSASAILMPYAIKEIMDTVGAARASGNEVWVALEDPILFFALLNVGLILFSRGSGTI
ncbi:MAG: ABC transporter ATP-binding protein, partial [Gammaproteobacteria bacterium]